jgi:hypothetical protein
MRRPLTDPSRDQLGAHLNDRVPFAAAPAERIHSLLDVYESAEHASTQAPSVTSEVVGLAAGRAVHACC